jgi:hypothetical protein
MMQDDMPAVQYLIRTHIMRYQSRSILHGIPVVARDLLDDPGDAVTDAALTIIRRPHSFPTGLSVFKQAFVDQ